MKTRNYVLQLTLGLLLITCGTWHLQAADIDIEGEKLIYSDIIRKIGPVIRFHPDEPYLPSSVEWALARSRLEDNLGNSVPVTIDNLTRESKRLIDLSPDATNTFLRANGNAKLGGDMASAKAYVHVLRRPTFTDLQFWLYYPYNGPGTLRVGIRGSPVGLNYSSAGVRTAPLGEHYADWETVVMRIDNRTQKLTKAFLSAHGHYQEYDPSQLEYENGHLVVYASLNGHGNYPHAGDNADTKPGKPLAIPATPVDVGCVPSVTVIPEICWPWPIDSCSPALVTPGFCVQFPIPYLYLGTLNIETLNICANGGQTLRVYDRFEIVGLYDSSLGIDFLAPKDPQTLLHWIEWDGPWSPPVTLEIYDSTVSDILASQLGPVSDLICGQLFGFPTIGVSTACDLFVRDIPLLGNAACDLVEGALAQGCSALLYPFIAAVPQDWINSGVTALWPDAARGARPESPGVRYVGATYQAGTVQPGETVAKSDGPNLWIYSTLPREATGFVIHTGDNGPGSLRQAIAGGGNITFDPALNGQTITLTNGALVVQETLRPLDPHHTAARPDVNIDASMLSQGITISGDNRFGVLEIGAGTEVEMNNLNIIRGNKNMGFISTGSGGGIWNKGGSVTILNSTIAANVAGFGGGGIANMFNGKLYLENCTIAGNSARLVSISVRGGGGVFNFGGDVVLKHCTVAYNVGGAVFNTGRLLLENTIVAQNEDYYDNPGDIPTQIAGDQPLTSGANIVAGRGGMPPAGYPIPFNVDPLLTTLAANGGPTQTIGLMPNSPAIDAAVASSLDKDQRFFPRPIGSAADIGAVEALIAGPHPAPGQANVSIQPTLTWGAVPGATLEVFLDNGSGTFASVGTTTHPTMTLDTLVAGTDYRWRVDTTLPNSTSGPAVTILGDTMTFSTRPGTLVVTTLVDERDPGLGLGNGNSLRECLVEAIPGEIITFARDLPGDTIEAFSQFIISRDVTVDASTMPDGVTINAAVLSRVFRIEGSAAVHLKRIKIRGGHAANGGGVEVQAGAALALQECVVIDNKATSEGGGIYKASGASLTVEGSTIAGNTALQGGGIFSDGTTGGLLTVQRSTFTANSAPSGAGIYLTKGAALVENSTLAGNAAGANQGGGLAVQDSAGLTLRHCTIGDNIGSGVFNFDATVTLENTIVANNFDVLNSPLDFQGNFTAVGANLVRIHSGTVVSGPAPLTDDPLLGPLASYGGATKTMPPLVGSPVLDAGVVTPNTPSTDQEYSFRPSGTAPEIGSVESRLSADTDLDWLTMSAGTLSPTFRSTLTDYIATVPNQVTTVAVRPAGRQFDQTFQVRINGGTFSPVQNKEASADLPLNQGENPIEIEVTAQNGATTKIYTVTVIRGAPSVENTSFASLSTSSGPLRPAFKPGVIFYHADVANSTATTVTATTANPAAKIEIRAGGKNFSPLAAGVASPLIPIEVGANPIDLRVTAADGTTVESYTIIVTRSAPALSNASLAGLSTSAGALSPAFSRGIPFYHVTVAAAVTSATVTATKVEPSATIQTRVNGGAFNLLTSGAPSSPIALSAGETFIEVQVTAPDGATVHSYTLIVTRVVESIEWASKLGDDHSGNASISADGRFVAFSSRAANLVPNDTNNGEDVFVYDRITDTIERVSVNNAGDEGDFTESGAEPSSQYPSISADGRFVAFQSRANNLVPNDTNAGNQADRGQDIFVYDRNTHTIERVSLSDSGGEANQQSERPSISGDGRYVAFSSSANNLVSGYANGEVNVYIHDRVSHTTVGIAVPFGGFSANRNSLNSAMSSDGNFVAFEFAVDKSVGVTPGYQYRDIYLYHRATLAVERVTGTRIGPEADQTDSRAPSISADGRYIVFQSNLENLDFYDTNNAVDVFVYDRLEETTRRVSTNREGLNEGFYESVNPALSGDGRYVAFESFSTSLVDSDSNGSSDVFLKDLVTGDISIKSATPIGVQADGDSVKPSVSFDGRIVAFQSLATNLSTPDTEYDNDVFVAVTEELASSSLADLASLWCNVGSLSPGFSPGTTVYSLNVANETTAALVRPVAADAQARIEVRIHSGDFSPLESNHPSSELSLMAGANVIEVKVTAPNGSTQKTYAVMVNRSLSHHAELSSLVLTPDHLQNLDLQPGFASGTTSYSVTVDTTMASVLVIPAAAGPGARVTVNGTVVASGAGSDAINLNPGENTITVAVLAEDGVATKSYSVKVSRPLGDNASLADLLPSIGTLTPAFSSQTYSYTMEVPGDTDAIMLTPITAHPKATAIVNRSAVSSGAASTPQGLYFGVVVIPVEVTAENGTTKTYTVTVTRAGSVSTPWEITGIEYLGGPNPKLRITWQSEPGAVYGLERSTALSDWESFGADRPSGGTVTTTEVDLPIPGDDKLFLRLRKY